MIDRSELKAFLEEKYLQYNTPDFIKDDPIQLPHLFTSKEDIEIIGFIVATIAWGNRKSIIKSGEKLVQVLHENPYEFVMNYEGQPLDFVHRTFNSSDLSYFLLSLKNIYTKYGGLENAFGLKTGQQGIKARIINFRNTFLELPHERRVEKHLSNPDKNSSAKRLNMFLRWMVRCEGRGVDFGLWKSVSPSELYLPLDVHTGNIGRKLGILTRAQNDWKAVEEIQSVLKELDPNDPVKYDFALFGLGVYQELEM